MKTCLQVNGYTDSRPDYDGKKTRKEYNCFVAYDTVEANRPIIASYLKYYLSHDPAVDPDYSHQFFNDHNCVKALVTYYFRDSFVLFEFNTVTFISEKALPNRHPDKEDVNHKLWAIETTSSELDTPKSAATILYRACSNGKIPIEIAQEMVRSEFPGNIFSWPEVLAEFRTLGGAHTKKYLRRQ